MKKIVNVTEVEGEGLLGMLGEHVLIYAMAFALLNYYVFRL